MLSKQSAHQQAFGNDPIFEGSVIRQLHLLREQDNEDGTAVLLVDSTALHADTVMDPGERCLFLYQNILRGTAAQLLLIPPAPPSGKQVTPTASRLLQAPSFFHSFLVAALRASANGQISLLLPLVQNTEEIDATRKMLNTAMNELYKRHEPFDEAITLGISLGTPKALIASRELLEDVDLLVVDTNALSHTVAEPIALLSLVEIAVGNAHVLHRLAIIDGVPATDPRVLPHLYAMGADAISCPFLHSVEISDKIHTKNSCK